MLLSPQGVFVFTVESLEDSELCLNVHDDIDSSDHKREYMLQTSGRIAHSKAYLEELIASLGDKFAVIR